MACNRAYAAPKQWGVGMRIRCAWRWIPVICIATLGGAAVAADDCDRKCDGNWIAAWGTAQQLVQPARPIPAAQTPPPRLVAQTVRMIARPTVSGSALRVALSNSFGFAPVRIDAAQVARHAGAGAIEQGSGRALTFGGHPWVVLPPGAQVYSDAFSYDVA